MISRTDGATIGIVASHSCTKSNSDEQMRKLFKGGQKLPTKCGRIIKFPVTNGSINQKILQVNQWLVREAIKEAIWRCDQFNLLQYADLIGRTLHVADLDSLNLYLFGNEDGPQTILNE